MKKQTNDRQAKAMGNEPQPVTHGKTATPNGDKKNKGYKEERDHTTGAQQGDTRTKADTNPE